MAERLEVLRRLSIFAEPLGVTFATGCEPDAFEPSTVLYSVDKRPPTATTAMGTFS